MTAPDPPPWPSRVMYEADDETVALTPEVPHELQCAAPAAERCGRLCPCPCHPRPRRRLGPPVPM